MSDRVVLLFTKPSEPGRVKTRLIGELTAEQAAQLHAAFVADLLERLRGGTFDLRVAWALEPGETPPQDGEESGVDAVVQQGTDLGERLYRALSGAAAEAVAVAAVGSDHPQLRRSDLDVAFDVLQSDRADVVIGPALDGGYYLLATPWSTPRVLKATLDRCDALGLRAHELPPAADVDTPADLAWLESELAAGRVSSPLTAGLLRSWGRLPGGAPEGRTE
jgi:rSAM/selenodomain-associated transferase 1